MIPLDALKKIRKVEIHYEMNEIISGFYFFDKDGAFLWKVGYCTYEFEKETVLLEENEMIVGVKGSISDDWGYSKNL